MNDDRELKTTIGFVIVAAALCGFAFVFGWATKPPSPAEFSDIGEQFYAEFVDPADATRLRLASWNDKQARTDVFEVKFTPESGWTIPSHNDYPADGEEQLSKTAASIVGITRGGLMPGRKGDHARYGVVDPLDQSATGTEGRGSRLTLWEGDTVVADYIIGKKVGDDDANASSGEALYYIRKAGDDGEDRVYRAALDVEISTDFADWIEPDLLQIGSVADIRRIVVDRYQVDEQTGRVSQGDRSIVTRSNATDPWELESLNEETESLVTGTVSKITTSLDDLEIIGVRKKPALLTAQLKQQELDGFSQLDVMTMRADLQSKGFFIDQTGALVSNEGDFAAGTNDGIMYTLRFGEVFSGSKASLEAGDQSEDAEEEDAEKPGETGNNDADATDSATSDDNENTLKGRYVFITAEFDKTLLSQPGEPPVKPVPPASTDAKKAADDKADGEEEPSAESEDADNAASDTNTDPAKDPEYLRALEQYEAELAAYNRAKEEFDKKVEAGQERVDELSQRFADWYYVIAAETFDDLAVDRGDLVEPKAAEAADPNAAKPIAPGLPPVGEDKVEPVMEAVKKAGEASTADDNKADDNKTDDKSKDAPPASQEKMKPEAAAEEKDTVKEKPTADKTGAAATSEKDAPAMKKPAAESADPEKTAEPKKPAPEKAASNGDEPKPAEPSEKSASPPPVPLPKVTPGPPKATEDDSETDSQ